MRRRAAFFDVVGSLERWPLSVHYGEGLVRAGLQPEQALEAYREELRAYHHREGHFDAVVEKLVEAHQGPGKMKGISRDDAIRVAREVVAEKGKLVNHFVRELLRASQRAGYFTAFVSGSPSEVVAEFATLWGVEASLGTEHPHEDGVFTGGKTHEWVLKKGEAVRHLAELHGLTLDGSLALGDSAGDIPMLELASYPVCYNPSRGLRNAARTNGWPIAVERKDVVYLMLTSPEVPGSICVDSLEHVLPSDILEQFPVSRFFG